MNQREMGSMGEELAQDFLKHRGYKILETNFLCRFGEADIIATCDGELSFIEVKTRGQELFGSPSDAVTYKKRKHIYKVAEFYLYKHQIVDIPISLDVIEVYLLNEGKTRIVHLRNAIIDKPEYTKRYGYHS